MRSQRRWLAVVKWGPGAYRLAERDAWIGWTGGRRRCLRWNRPIPRGRLPSVCRLAAHKTSSQAHQAEAAITRYDLSSRLPGLADAV